MFELLFYFRFLCCNERADFSARLFVFIKEITIAQLKVDFFYSFVS